MRQWTLWAYGLAFCAVLGASDVNANPGHRIDSRDITYLGAFRLPSKHGYIGAGENADLLAWCKGIEAYYPAGDPGGPNDGFPGSLFGVGHAWVTPAFEISIPRPVRSDDVNDLPIATLLQDPQNIHGSIAISGDDLKAIEWFPKQGSMTSDKLHITFGQHYQYDRRPTHGWTNLDLSNPQAAGPWHVGQANQVNCLNTNEYNFVIPKAFADLYTGGKRLASGRHREGQASAGPTIIAYAPWLSGNPPAPNTELEAKPLVLYRDNNLEDGLDGHCWADNWTAGAWLTRGAKSAVVIMGTKGYGNCWYGWQDGTTPEECAHWPGGCEANGYGGDDRGFCADSFKTVMLFFDPADLARVARGEIASYEPQPYETWDITPYMMQPETSLEIGLGGAAYDEQRNLLYVTEFYGEREKNKPVVHVFAINPVSPGHADPTHLQVPRGEPGAYSGTETLASAAPRPLSVTVAVDRASRSASIRMAGPVPSTPRRITIHDVRGRVIEDFGSRATEAVQWSTRGVANGVYFVRVVAGEDVVTRKVVVVD